MSNRGFFFSLSALFILLAFLLFYMTFIENSLQKKEVEIEKNRLILFEVYTKDAITKYFPSMVELAVKDAITEALDVEHYDPDALNMTNISANITEAVITGKIGNATILSSSKTLTGRVAWLHGILLQKHRYNMTLSTLSIRQEAFNIINASYELNYTLRAEGMEFSENLKGVVRFSPSGMIHPLYGQIRVQWFENSTTPCILNYLDTTYNCGVINGIAPS
ncbi:hypothetical protein H6504_02370 [Candidatus Woesearchaeota archaeon]|nr:hypothetical protein [Candidatus Woesearchaeota archaeon]